MLRFGAVFRRWVHETGICGYAAEDGGYTQSGPTRRRLVRIPARRLNGLPKKTRIRAARTHDTTNQKGTRRARRHLQRGAPDERVGPTEDGDYTPRKKFRVNSPRYESRRSSFHCCAPMHQAAAGIAKELVLSANFKLTPFACQRRNLR